MIGHELTAKHGLDHGQSLAVVLPSLLHIQRDSKRAKLLQYAERVWNLHDGNEEYRIDAAIAATRNFFEEMATPVWPTTTWAATPCPPSCTSWKSTA